MSAQQRNPPAVACALLLCFCPKRNREAITGDLIERFREGRSDMWFWRQVLSAILIGLLSQLRHSSPEICLAGVGTGLIWFFPWGTMFPLLKIITSMNWWARLEWFIVIQTMTALMILPLFAILFRIRRTLGWANLVRVFLIYFMLLNLADFPILWWNVRHPAGITRSQAIWAVPMMVGWMFAELLISTWLARRLPSPSKTIPT